MFRLKTFGGLSIEGNGVPLTGAAAQRRRLAILALVAASGDRGVTRDKILALLWPDSDDERARHVLTQLLYAVRRDLNADVLVASAHELRLNPQVITSDVGEFDDALQKNQMDRAVGLYAGPFLDAWHLSDAIEYERWVEEERARLAQRAARALESLARDATARGDHRAAVQWWRRLAALDPLSARTALGVMRALAADGDRAGALQHARTYGTLLRQELDAAPDPAVVALVDQLRAEPSPAAADAAAARGEASGVRTTGSLSDGPAAVAASMTGAHASAAATAGMDRGAPPDARATPIAAPAGQMSARRLRRRVVGAGALAVSVVTAVLAVAGRGRDAAVPVVAVGAIQDYSAPDSARLARALGDMLSTNLARVAGLHVVSNARLYDLVGQSGEHMDAATAVARSARRAGATELVDGSLYRRPGGSLRFDIRRVDLVTGAVRAAYTVEGPDPFTVVDRATAELAAGFRMRADTLRVTDVTTTSLVAYRLYEEGLRAYYQRSDAEAAYRLFAAALDEDSTFAMGSYMAFLTGSALSLPDHADHLAQAVRMANRATDRERLLILTAWTLPRDQPAALALAETLAARYPAEPDGHYLLGRALDLQGDFLGALPHLHRVVAMDSLSLRGVASRCRACEALSEIVLAYAHADSLDAAERTAREFVRLRSSSAAAWHSLADVLELRGSFGAALDARRAVDRLGRVTPFQSATLNASIALRAGDFTEVERLLNPLLRDTAAAIQGEALWYLVIGLRYQGRHREALGLARRFRRLRVTDSALAAGSPAAGPVSAGLLEAQVLFEQGRAREAAAIFDSIAATPPYKPWLRAGNARHRAWLLTHTATALAAAGDTGRLATLSDTIQALGPQSVYGRDRLLHHHVRGLLFAARGRLQDAEAAFRRAVFSPTFGYTRTNLELGRTLLALRRPAEATAVLRPALQGSLQASNLYVTHTELHELLARAFEAAGQADSAAVHYRFVVAAWRRADPQFHARRESARRRLELSRRAVSP